MIAADRFLLFAYFAYKMDRALQAVRLELILHLKAAPSSLISYSPTHFS